MIETQTKILLTASDPIGKAETLDDAKAVATVLIERAAEAARQRFVTPGSGKSMVYDEKVREATAHAADGSPDPADYPILNSTVGVDGATLADVAALVLAKRDAWKALAADIEGKEASGKAGVAAAPDVAAIRNAMIIAWPKP